MARPPYRCSQCRRAFGLEQSVYTPNQKVWEAQCDCVADGEVYEHGRWRRVNWNDLEEGQKQAALAIIGKLVVEELND